MKPIGFPKKMSTVFGFVLVAGAIAVSMLGCLAWAASNSYYLDTSRLEIKVNPATHTASGTVKVSSNSDQPVRIKVTPKLWQLDSEGNLHYIEPPTAGYNLLSNLLLNPSEFELQPGKNRTVRFMVKVPDQNTDTEYPFQLIFEPSDVLNQSRTSDAGSGSIRQSLEVVPVFTTTVYAYQGKPQPAVSVQQFTCNGTAANQVSVHFKVANTGNKHARLSGNLIVSQKISATGAFSPASLVKLRGGNLIFVFPGTERTISEVVEVTSEKLKTLAPGGDYTLELQLSDERGVQPAVQSSCALHVP